MKPLSIICLAILAIDSAVYGFQPGDRVAVVQSAPIRSGGKTVGTVEPGNTLVVGRIGDEGLWVNFKAAGWIDPTNVVPLDEAEKHFADRIRSKPDDAEAFYGRAKARMAKEQWVAAMEDLNEAA